MSTVRIKARIIDDFTRTTQQHINQSDLPLSYSADGTFIYKVVSSKEYLEMLESPDGIHMSELGIAATLDKGYNQ
jgi:hypothetical protein